MQVISFLSKKSMSRYISIPTLSGNNNNKTFEQISNDLIQECKSCHTTSVLSTILRNRLER